MPRIDQSRPFKTRLGDFGPELGKFLDLVWARRRQINLGDFDTGVGQVYALYSGAENKRKFRRAELETFIKGLRTAAGAYPIHPQRFPEAAALEAWYRSSVR